VTGETQHQEQLINKWHDQRACEMDLLLPHLLSVHASYQYSPFS